MFSTKSCIFDTMRNSILLSITLILASLLSTTESTAQYKLDYGFRAGTSNYLGEMGGEEQTRRDFIWDMKLNQSRTLFGAFMRYRINHSLAFNYGLTYARIQGNDALSTNPARRARNLNFRNDMVELYGRFEYYFFDEKDVGNHGRYLVDFQAFVFAGVAAIAHAPKTHYNGEWVSLRPLMTEGQKYTLVTAGSPVGLGFFFTHKRRHRFGWEISWTPTLTDYLDDVSTVYVDGLTGTAAAVANRRPELGEQPGVLPSMNNYGYAGNNLDEDGNVLSNPRGDASHNDTYMFTSLSYSYVVKGANRFYSRNYGWLGYRKRGVRKVRAKF